MVRVAQERLEHAKRLGLASAAGRQGLRYQRMKEWTNIKGEEIVLAHRRQQMALLLS